jgi:DNA-binding CsgD family transcriptional regulator
MTCSHPTSNSLREIVSGEGFAANAMRIIQEVPNVIDNAQIVEFLHRAAHAFGADHAAFVSFVRGHDSTESFRFLLACNPLWCLEYQQQGWFAHDPWLQYAESHSSPICASKIDSKTRCQRAVVDLAEKYGVASAYIVPAPSCGQVTRLGVLMLGSRQRGYFEDEECGPVKVLARSLSMELHEWWVRAARRDLLEKYHLTSEDVELLRMEREGLGSKQIADRLNTSRSAVDSRFQRICAKFHLPNRRATAHAAAEHGVI